MATNYSDIPYRMGTRQSYHSASQKEWFWMFLGLEPDAALDEIDTAYRRLAKQLHPDHGGSDQDMVRLNMARECAMRVSRPKH